VNAAGREIGTLDSVGPARYANVSVCNFEQKRPVRDPI
jgi:hypothetical protein